MEFVIEITNEQKQKQALYKYLRATLIFLLKKKLPTKLENRIYVFGNIASKKPTCVSLKSFFLSKKLGLLMGLFWIETFYFSSAVRPWISINLLIIWIIDSVFQKLSKSDPERGYFQLVYLYLDSTSQGLLKQSIRFFVTKPIFGNNNKIERFTLIPA